MTDENEEEIGGEQWFELPQEVVDAFFGPSQTTPETVADLIPGDGTYTMDSDGIWTWQLLMGWPVRYG